MELELGKSSFSKVRLFGRYIKMHLQEAARLGDRSPVVFYFPFVHVLSHLTYSGKFSH